MYTSTFHNINKHISKTRALEPSRLLSKAAGLNNRGIKSSSKKLPIVASNDDTKKSVVSETVDPRINPVNIQMLSSGLYRQIFGKDILESADFSQVEKAQIELKKHGLWKEAKILPDVHLKLPKLLGENIEQHFFIIGEEQAGPYRKLLLDFIKYDIPEKPQSWVFEPGWTKYKPGSAPESVAFPDEDVLVLDIEVCVKLGHAPTLATAVSPEAWYGWVCSSLPESTSPVAQHSYTTDMLIPLEGRTRNKNQHRIVVGHNVSYDRARIKEEYCLEASLLRFLDTMSLHVCVGGVTSYQRAMLKVKTNDESEAWRDYTSLNSLKEVYKLYCQRELSKEERNIFVEGDLADIRIQFQELMTYCAGDVSATFQVLQKLLVLFLKRFPHPVTLAGMLEMSTAYLPVNSNWDRYISDTQQTYEDVENEAFFLLGRKCDNACQLLHDNQYKRDLWMWDEDWSTQELKLTKKKLKHKQGEEKLDKEKGAEEDDGLEKRFQYLFDLGQVLPAKRPHLPGYPLWYRKLCEKPTGQDWVPGPKLVSTGVKVTPKILNLTWEKYPLHHTREFGWGILVADVNAEPKDCLVPYEELKKLTLENSRHKLQQKKCEKNTVPEDFWEFKEWSEKAKKDVRKDIGYSGTGVWCGHLVEDCCYFLKLPHKDGTSNNVGNPLARDFLKTFSTSVLAGSDSAAEKVLTIGRMLSYWRNNRERIEGQMVVWLSPKEAGVCKDQDTEVGVILPKVVVCGTLTRRAMEPTWMTASNAQAERIGSELRCMIQAPPGYHIVGADVDSQELWIASILGDSHFAQMHGSTPLGWMTLSGTKTDGTDLHSVTAAASGISRDHAKVINYARIYGAGVRFAQRLLKQFNPSMSDTEAKQKGMKMFLLTKGKKTFRLKDVFRAEVPSEISDTHTSFSAIRVAKMHGKTVDEMFEKPEWVDGTESAMFNRLEQIASSYKPATTFLGGRLSRALEPKYNSDEAYMTTRVNWVVQSGAVDFLHLMLVCMRWLTNGHVRYSLSFHDEVRYLVRSELRYQAALAINITNLLTRAFCARRLGLTDLPLSVAFFSSVEVDTVLRKEANHDCITPSNPHGLHKGYGVPPGESLSIYEVIEKTDGKLSGMSRATKRKHVIKEVLHDELSAPTENQMIVQVLQSRGNNLHEVRTTDKTTFLVTMPSKFRRNIWVKKGDFIIVEPIEEGDKVKAEMVSVVTNEYLRFLKSKNLWPKEFEEEKEGCVSEDGLFVNTNRKTFDSKSDSEESSEDSE